MQNFTQQNWPGGVDNRENHRTMPEGFVRRLVNLDATPGGSLELRPGYEKVVPGSQVRGAIGFGDEIVFADGGQLKSLNTRTGTAHVIGSIAASGRFAGAIFNNELFLSTDSGCYRYNGQSLRRWGVPTVHAQPVPTVGTGGLAKGGYQYAITSSVNGEEGGTVSPSVIVVEDGASLTFDVPAGCNLYVSPVNGETLYLQARGGAYTVSAVIDSTARLETQFLDEPVACDLMAAHKGVILQAASNVLWHTVPLRPHLRAPMRGFFQYPAPIRLLAAVDDGVYVVADHTYFLTGIGTDEPVQFKTLEHTAVPGSMTMLPDGRVAWMTPYGLAIGAAQGICTLTSDKHFSPDTASSGASGLIEHNGNQLVVTTLRGDRQENALAAIDTCDIEAVYP